MGLALDESKDGDEIFEKGGFTFVIEKKLLEEVKPVTVDYVTTPRGEGFVVKTGIKADCGGCTSC
ncbi:MAG TPA: hypothetical protein PLS81_06900 [Deltaproteobacteria bacterium]|nr:hypothetical protein [Deltaproteobacteria bacterium]HOM29167.1 hypothetical protein [Deltaproteobacteria bacterium]HPP80844.1 hypothetical protein [Deltaproteobacteria bacterium]